MLEMCTYFFEKIHLEGLTLTDGFSFTVLGGNDEKVKNTVLGYKKGSKSDNHNFLIFFEKFRGELC